MYIPAQEVKKRYQGISDILQDTLYSERSSDAVWKAATFANIEDKVSELARQAGYVLLGYLNPIDFNEEIQKELDISADVAKQIYSQLDAEIFSLVESDLRKLYPPTIKTPTVIAGGFAGPAIKIDVEQPQERKPEPNAFERRFLKHKLTDEKESAPEPKTHAVEAKSAPAQATPDIVQPEKPKQTPVITPPRGVERKIFTFKKEEELKKPDLKPIYETKKPEPVIPKKIEIKPSQDEDDSDKDEFSHIKPVVPLPTFVQPQFQAQKRKEDSVYREKVAEEDLKPLERSDDKKPAPKLNGNVIDLRDL